MFKGEEIDDWVTWALENPDVLAVRRDMISRRKTAEDTNALNLKLLSLGGKVVADDDDKFMYVSEILSRGVLLSDNLDFKRGLSDCHRNSAALWEKNPKQYTIYTGWALSGWERKTWIRHSWVYDIYNESFVETKRLHSEYYGFPLTFQESVEFYIIYKLRYPFQKKIEIRKVDLENRKGDFPAAEIEALFAQKDDTS